MEWIEANAGWLWLVLAAVSIAVPLVAVAVTGLFVRSRLPMSRRMT